MTHKEKKKIKITQSNTEKLIHAQNTLTSVSQKDEPERHAKLLIKIRELQKAIQVEETEIKEQPEITEQTQINRQTELGRSKKETKSEEENQSGEINKSGSEKTNKGKTRFHNPKKDTAKRQIHKKYHEFRRLNEQMQNKSAIAQYHVLQNWGEQTQTNFLSDYNTNYKISHGLEANPEALEAYRRLTTDIGPFSGNLPNQKSLIHEQAMFSGAPLEDPRPSEDNHLTIGTTGLIGDQPLYGDSMNENSHLTDLINPKYVHIPGIHFFIFKNV